MHLSCYKIKLHYYYLLSPLRCTSTVFYFVRHQQKLQKLHGCNRYPPSSPKRLTFPRIPFPFPSPVSFHALLSPLALSFSSRPSISLALSSLVVPCCLPGQEKAYARHCADPELRRSGNCVKFTVERYSIDCGVCI